MREARMRQESRGASFTFEIGLTKLEPVVISMDNLLPILLPFQRNIDVLEIYLTIMESMVAL